MDEGGGGGTFHLIVFFFLMVKSGAFHCFKPDSHFAKYQKKSRALILQKLEATFLLHLRRILIFFYFLLFTGINLSVFPLRGPVSLESNSMYHQYHWMKQFFFHIFFWTLFSAFHSFTFYFSEAARILNLLPSD